MFGENTDGSLLDLYNDGKFEELSKKDLTKPVNSRGDTILHKIAQRADLQSVQKLSQYPKCITYLLVNKPNAEGDMPIHVAHNSGEPKEKIDKFINFLVEKLDANPNIPNRKGDKFESMADPNSSLNFTETAEPQNYPKNNNVVINFIINLINKYSNPNSRVEPKSLSSTLNLTTDNAATLENPKAQPLVGGYKGTRYIHTSTESMSNYLDETDSRSFVVKGRNALLANYQMTMDRPKPDPAVSKEYNDLLKRIMKLLEVDEETAKIYRSGMKLNVMKANEELRSRDADGIRVEAIKVALGFDKNKQDYSKDNDKAVIATLKKIDVGAIKKYIDEQKKKSQEFIEARKKERGESSTSSDRKPKKFEKRTPRSETSEPFSETEKKSDKSAKPKKGKSESGYLKSADLIFSSDNDL